ncbi:hypothetical protein ACOSQ2_031105 [Xanthoceras sorbifolium]
MDTEEIQSRCVKLLLSDADGPVAKIGEELKEARLRKLALSLVGKVIANKEVNRDAFKAAITFFWRITKAVEIETEIISGTNGECLGKFIRVRVMVNVLNPLKRGIRIVLGVKGVEDCNVLLCYEKLLNFCYFWGCLGHLISDCMDSDKGLVDDSDFRYGA